MAGAHPRSYISLILLSFGRRNVNCPLSLGHWAQWCESSHADFAHDLAATKSLPNIAMVCVCFLGGRKCMCMCTCTEVFSLPHTACMNQRWHHKDTKICMICERLLCIGKASGSLNKKSSCPIPSSLALVSLKPLLPPQCQTGQRHCFPLK